jgi:hypothetical protein
LQITASIIASGGAVCEFFVDMDYPAGFVAATSPWEAALLALGASVGATGFGGMVMTCPSVIGLEWDDKSAATGVFATESVLFLAQLAGIVVYLAGRVTDAPALKSGNLVGVWEAPVAQGVSTVLNLISLGFSCAALHKNAWTGYQFAANFVRLLPEVLLFIRWRKVKPDEPGPGYSAFLQRSFFYAGLTAYAVRRQGSWASRPARPNWRRGRRSVLIRRWTRRLG